MSKCNCQDNDNGGSFVFGLILGCIVGAIVAIVIYKKSKGKILDQLKEKFKDFIAPEPPPHKVDVVIPPNLVPTPSKVIASKPKKLFIKPKK